jgi:hypothetical protein
MFTYDCCACNSAGAAANNQKIVFHFLKYRGVSMKNKFSMAMSLAVILAMLLTSVGLADNVVNDVTAGGTDTFTAPGSTTVGYKINTAAAGDPQSGCNASDGSPATVTLSVPAGVMASATSLTFTACNVFQNVTFSSSTPGNYAINVSSISDSGAGSYNNQANFTLHVNAPPPPPNTAPSVSVTGVTNGATYEAGSVPAAGCSVTDAEDGNSTFAATLSPITGPLAAYGLGSQTASCAYTDGGGLSDSDSATYSIIDTTDPIIAFVSRTPANANGWNNGDVTVNWSCSDTGSGVVNASVSQTVSAEGANQSATGTCQDNAGNTAIDTQTGINIDLTDPLVSLVGGPANGGSYYFGSVPAAPTCSANDALSGLDGSCSLSGYSTAVGSHTMTASGTDNAGNSASASASYTVNSWTLNGFYQPVDMNNVVNTVKGGSTVPLKFEVFAGPSELTATSVVQSFVQTRIVCDTSATIDEIEVTTTGGTSLRYDATAGQFIQNWQTPRSPGACYRVTMTTQDGSALVAFFKLK